MRDVRAIERWKKIPDWPDYAVSDFGRIKRLTTYGRAKAGTIRKPVYISGYAAVTLTNRDGRRKLLTVHGLVAAAFLEPKPFPEAQVNHKDSDRRNPRLDNLEWTTGAGNIQHGYDVGNCDARGERNGHSKLTESAVRDIRARYATADRDSLAQRHGVSPKTVRDVASGRTWQHIT